VAVVKKGTVMFEVDYPNLDMAKEALRLAMHKLPIKCKIVTRADNASVLGIKNIKKELGESNGHASN